MKREAEYLRIYRKLRNEIVQGAYAYGMRLPSKRATAQAEGVSPITVEHAYALLCEEGYLQARERSGCYVIYRKEELFSMPEKELAETAVSSGAQEESFPYTVFARAVRKVLADHGSQILSPTEGTGCLYLRRAIASYLLRSRNISVKPEQIVIGSGSEYLYSLVVQIAGRDCVYGIEDPSYAQIRNIYQASGAKVDPLPLTENGIDSKALQKTDAAVLHVTPYRSFPSMNTADENKLREYVQWAVQRDALIIEDDYASEFTAPGRARPTLFSMEPVYHIIYMNTFTKTIASSVRAGYMILPEQRTQEILDMISFRSCTVSSLLQYTIAEVLNNGSFERHLNRMRRMHRKEQV